MNLKRDGNQLIQILKSKKLMPNGKTVRETLLKKHQRCMMLWKNISKIKQIGNRNILMMKPKKESIITKSIYE